MTQSNVTTANDLGFDAEVLAAEEPVLVDFTAKWCGPCKRLAPILDEIADRHRGRYKVVAVDVEEAPLVVARYGVRGTPTLMVFRCGEPVAQHVGLTTESKLLALLAQAG